VVSRGLILRSMVTIFSACASVLLPVLAEQS
jgi:hypothetical protein